MVHLTSKPTPTIKLLCSYGGKILPRHPDGKLRYLGGHTRVLTVDRSISFSELLLKLTDMYGASVNLRCQLPTEDLDALISITSDEDLANLIEEYDRAASLKIRAFLSPPKSITNVTSTLPTSPMIGGSSSKSSSSSSLSSGGSPVPVAENRCQHHMTSNPSIPVMFGRKKAYYSHGYPGHVYVVHNGNQWQ